MITDPIWLFYRADQASTPPGDSIGVQLDQQMTPTSQSPAGQP
jgi:hypothetical protein